MSQEKVLDLSKDGAAAKKKIKAASLQNALKHRQDRASAGQVYAEDKPSSLDAIFSDSPNVQESLKGAKNMSPEERAEMGGKLGAHVGNKIAGAHGSLIGAAIGSDAVRSLGVAQAGEEQTENSQNEMLEVLRTAKLIDESGNLRFKDGGSIDLSDSTSDFLPNISPNVVGKEARSLYETDPTNPFTDRASVVSKVLAYYLVGALMQKSDFSDEGTISLINDTASMLVNAFENGVKTINSVYSRAQEIAKRLKISKSQVSQFFFDQRSQISKEDATDIKRGIDILFG